MKRCRLHACHESFSFRQRLFFRRTAIQNQHSTSVFPCKLLRCLLFCHLLYAAPGYAQAEPVDLSPVELELSTRTVAGVPASSTSQQALPQSPVPRIATSRPSFTDAPTTVPKGSLQAESGATYIDYPSGLEQWILPETLLRLGVTPNTELRYAVPNYIYLGDDDAGTILNNFGGMSAALSQHVALPAKIDMAIIPVLNIPSGTDIPAGNAVDPEIRLVLAKKFTPKLQLSGMMASRWTNSRDASQKSILNPTVCLNYSLTDAWDGFLEYAGFVAAGSKNQKTRQDLHYVQAGLTYVLKKRHQFDVRAAVGLNKRAGDFLVGFGYSFRLDGLF